MSTHHVQDGCSNNARSSLMDRQSKIWFASAKTDIPDSYHSAFLLASYNTAFVDGIASDCLVCLFRVQKSGPPTIDAHSGSLNVSIAFEEGDSPSLTAENARSRTPVSAVSLICC